MKNIYYFIPDIEGGIISFIVNLLNTNSATNYKNTVVLLDINNNPKNNINAIKNKKLA